jgi:hypothetical protein
LYNINKELINKYLNEVNWDIYKLYTDTTFINNLYGIENVNYNPYNSKHKSTKLSLIIDEYNISINITVNNCKENDSSILNSQLDILKNKHIRRKYLIFSSIDIRKNTKHFFLTSNFI